MDIYDIVVFGSTSGAVAAAIQSSRLGRSVALVSPHKHIGGIQINGLGSSDIDNQPEFQNSTTLGGLSLEIHRRISIHYGRIDRLEEVVSKGAKDAAVWKFESRVAERVIRDWLAEEPRITIIHGHLADESAVTLSSCQVDSIKLSDGKTVRGKIFIDASYEGDFLAASGIATTYGRESIHTYAESLAGIRATTPYRQIPTSLSLDPYNTPGDASSGLLFGISSEPFGRPGDGDKHLQGYSYRVPLTDNPDNRVPFQKPERYDPKKYELHRRFYGAGGELHLPVKRVPCDKTDLIGSESPLATDLLGMNDEWPTASTARRQEILEETKRFTMGLLWFWANDDSIPEEYRKAWSTFGYCRDEFPDNDHFPRQLYIRDARRMVSKYVITEHTASRDGPAQVEDPIAVAFWPTDTHSVRRILRDGKVHNEGFIFKDGHKWRPFGIAYRALLPRREEARNVMTVTCPSSSHVGYGAVRLEHQFHAIGQACANASDIALRDGLDVQDVPYSELSKRLKDQGVVLDAESVGVPRFAGK